MIVEAIIDFFMLLIAELVELVASVIPAAPAWWIEGMGYVSDVVDWIYQLDTWLPVTVALSAVSILIVAFVASMVIQGVRTVVSYVTFGGGM
ncbi:hypothetical protein [Nocardioides sp.]|uniref:hypothetical protein n=1 Tax=Nocardioides sp. TaxID=35761 RepID=UPI0039E4CFF6